MVDYVLPKEWQPPDWHPDFGDVKAQLEELRSLAVAICEALPGTLATLVTPEPGLMSMAIETPSGVSAEIHSIPSAQGVGKRRFAIFVSPNDKNELEEYANSEDEALEFLVRVAHNRRNDVIPLSVENQMRTITIVARNKPPGFSDPRSAITSAKELNSRFHSEIEVRNLFGRVVKCVTYDDCRCAFTIDDAIEFVVEVVAEDAKFRCFIRSIDDETSRDTNDCKELNVVVGVRRSVWDRKGIVDEIVGKRLENLFFNGINTYLYFSGGMTVAFNSVVTVPDGHPLLYWTFAD